MLHSYEQTLDGTFGSGVALGIKSNREKNEHETSSYMVFDQLNESIAGDEKLNEWEQLSEKMQNPCSHILKT